MSAPRVTGRRRRRLRSSSTQETCGCYGDDAPGGEELITTDPALALGVSRQARPGGAAKARPVWAALTGPYGLFLLLLLIVPLANVALFSIHRYSPTQVALPELTFDNYRKIADLYYLRLFARTLKLGLITTVICALL